MSLTISHCEFNNVFEENKKSFQKYNTFFGKNKNNKNVLNNTNSSKIKTENHLQCILIHIKSIKL